MFCVQSAPKPTPNTETCNKMVIKIYNTSISCKNLGSAAPSCLTTGIKNHKYLHLFLITFTCNTQDQRGKKKEQMNPPAPPVCLGLGVNSNTLAQASSKHPRTNMPLCLLMELKYNKCQVRGAVFQPAPEKGFQDQIWPFSPKFC